MNSTISWILVILAIFLMLPTASMANTWASDEIAHAGGSFVFSSATYVLLKRTKMNKFERLLSTAVIAGTVGVLKEVTDQQLSETDLQADAAGIGASLLFMFSIDW